MKLPQFRLSTVLLLVVILGLVGVVHSQYRENMVLTKERWTYHQASYALRHAVEQYHSNGDAKLLLQRVDQTDNWLPNHLDSSIKKTAD